jgi:murein DD-endopeptidase MepM/ murein hydrolase activator NlpD
MHIIVISDRLAKARTLTLSGRHLVLSLVGTSFLLLMMTSGLYWVTLRLATEFKIPVLYQIVEAVHQSENERSRAFVQQNLNAMAIKLGEIQAQVTRLDALGERLSGLAGMRAQDFRFNEAPGMGGPASVQREPRDLSLTEFSERLEKLSQQMENRTEILGVLEAQLFEQAVKKKLLPTMLPVDSTFSASSYGMRIDPFTGQHAMHEGIDFIAETGTPIVAAAGGVVTFAGVHPQYGMMIDIDHGNELVTRYAHCSKILVKEGEVLKRGRKIAEVGSTGRSTGPHLHFEVRYHGAAQNPGRFLFASNGQSAQKPQARGR